MKIDNLTLVNFGGLQGRHEIDMPHLAALVGKNGMGKTTVLNGLRYALTGAEPEGDIINKACDACAVHLTMTDPVDGAVFTFSRIKDRSKPLKCQINGKATTKASLNTKIADVIGIPTDRISILSSSDVIAAMKPQEFASFILEYIPERLKADEIVAMIPGITPGLAAIVRSGLPEDNIEMGMLDTLDASVRESRKNLRASIDAQKLLLSSKPSENPYAGKEEEIRASIEQFSKGKAAYDVYLEKMNAYKRSVEAVNRHKAMMADLRKQIEASTAVKPDPLLVEKADREVAARRETVQNTRIGISGVSAGLAQLRVSLENLSNPICPLSEKIRCTQDKSAAKAELEESITASEEGLKAMKEELAKAEAALAAAEEKRAGFQKQETEYMKKISLKREYSNMEKAAPVPVPAPDPVEVPDEAVIDTLTKQLKVIESYNEGKKLAASIEALESQYKDYDAMVKALAEKGPVRTGVLAKYLGVFEDTCNERAHKVRPEINFRFEADGGVVVLMDNGKGAYLPYSALSGGEKAFMLFILMDMLNALSGSRILFLDELSVIDTKCFDALLDIIMAYEADYDHILIAAVDHPDTVASVKSHGIPFLGIGEPAAEEVM